MLGMFFSSTMIMVSIALVMAVIVTNIYAKKDTPHRCPEWTVRLASRFYPAFYLPPATHHGGVDPGGRACPLPAVIERRPATGSSAAAFQLTPSHSDAAEKGEVAAYGDGDCFSRMMAHCGCLGHRRGGSSKRGHGVRASRAPPRRPSLRRQLSVPTTLENFDFRRSEAEWRMVAKFTDRVFFWLFLVMSLCVQGSLFLQMIPETRHAIG